MCVCCDRERRKMSKSAGKKPSRLHLSRFTRVKVLVVVDNNLERFSLLFLWFSCISIIAWFNWMLAFMLEISASMKQLNTRVYAILETHSIKETGADIWRQRFHSVYDNIRLRPSTRRHINGVFKYIHFGERFRIYAFTVSVFIVFVWTEGLNA